MKFQGTHFDEFRCESAERASEAEVKEESKRGLEKRKAEAKEESHREAEEREAAAKECYEKEVIRLDEERNEPVILRVNSLIVILDKCFIYLA